MPTAGHQGFLDAGKHLGASAAACPMPSAGDTGRATATAASDTLAPSRKPSGKRPGRRLLGAIVPVPSATKTQDRQRRPWLVSFGEGGALFSTRAGTSLSEGGCSDLDPFRGSGCDAKLTCSRLVRLAKTVRFLGPLIAAVHCHSPSSRTRREHSRLERASPAALQPTSPRHKRLKSSSVGSLKPAERDNPPTLEVKHFGAPEANRRKPPAVGRIEFSRTVGLLTDLRQTTPMGQSL
jgi:hypothetical protein